MNRPTRHTLLMSGLVAIATTTFHLTPVHAADHAVESAPEAAYADSVRTLLDHQKRLPTSREASLAQAHGTTAVAFVLARSGQVVTVDTITSSGSSILDAQAKALVHRARYPAFPEGAWDGAAKRRFTVKYRFEDKDGTVELGEITPDREPVNAESRPRGRVRSS